MAWFKYGDRLYNLDNGTTIHKVKSEGQFEIVISVLGGVPDRVIPTNSASNTEKVFKDICMKLCSEHFH